jgi:hypothetical protein
MYDYREIASTLFSLVNETRSCSEEEMINELVFHEVPREVIDNFMGKSE